ncbi:phosphatase and actin regulator 4B-like isoform X2 [Saccostrea echinata]|uniref:phosphatase and actin regulator 4B-like isoform X1 n=1 Tax=Saccostrea echinata TaxID=191078 RepID=UPI002A80CA28|nr:phosphatase and actin regulator 4B-like isoform X1 [Saccostrea echinata]XP_061191459.1 phosphatase and actin regulator 4B-like isoform X2 [Saccostrea echinata]
MATDSANVTGHKYTRQRSNSDPQASVDPLSTESGEKDKKKNGEMKSATLSTTTQHTPPPERKSKFSSIGKIFKPWKWKRKKKSEKIERTAKEIERKISIRSTREELIRKGVLKDVDAVSTSKPTSGEPKTADNAQSLQVEVTSESNHINTEAVTEVSSSDVSTSECNGTATVDSVSMETTPVTITTQAEITSCSANTTAPVLTTAQVRPMVFPHLQGTTTPDSGVSTTESPPPPQEEKPMDPPPQPAPEQQEVAEVKVEEPVEFSDPTGTFQIAPASDWDNSKLPKKSALKGAGQAESPPVTDSSSVHFSHVDIIDSPPPVEVVPVSEPKSSPKATPVAAPRPKLRGGLSKFTASDNKENQTDTPVAKPSFTNSQTDKSDYNPADDSSSDDEEIRYRDDEDEEEDEPVSALAAKVARQDSLARFLSNRPSRTELVEKNIIQEKSILQKTEDRNAIGSKLIRRLSLRPTQEELEQRNILHTQSIDQAEKDKEEKKRYLIRKLSFRPSIEELKERKIIKFNDYVEWTDAHEYDRRADKPWTRLTPKDKAAIRKELNEFKSKEMDVHEESKHLTRFHRP